MGARHRRRWRLFAEAYWMLNNRIAIFVNLPMARLNRLSLQRHLDDIGRTE